MLGKIYAAIFKMVINHAVLTLSKTWSDLGMHIPNQFNCLSKCKKMQAHPRGLFKTNTRKHSDQNMIWLV